MLTWGTFLRERPHVETDLAARAEDALRSAGQSWASVRLNGRDAIITGRARKDGEGKAALDAVRSVWGIRTTQLKTDLAQAPSPPLGIGPGVAQEVARGGTSESNEETSDAARREAQAKEEAVRQAEAEAEALRAQKEAEAARVAREEAEALRAKDAAAELAAREAEDKARREAEAAAARAAAEREAQRKAQEEREAAAARRAQEMTQAALAAQHEVEAAEAAAAAEQARREAEAAATAEQARREAEAAAAAEKARQEAERAARKTTEETRLCEKQLTEAARAGVILFDWASSEIDSASARTITQLADIIKACPGTRVEVEGHTDTDGIPERNQPLSERRAQAVVDSLVAEGVPAERLTWVGYAAERPVAANDTSDGRAKNRRIEFKVFID